MTLNHCQRMRKVLGFGASVFTNENISSFDSW